MAQQSLTVNISVTIASALTLITTAISGAVGQALSVQLQVTGGVAPYLFTVLGGMTPGLTLSPTGLLSGTPTTAGASNPSIKIDDSGVA